MYQVLCVSIWCIMLILSPPPLPQVMYERPPTKSGRSSEPRRQDREIRKLRGELQHEAEKFQNMVRKYQKELEDVQSVSGGGMGKWRGRGVEGRVEQWRVVLYM